MDAKAILVKWATQEWSERHKELEEAIKEEMEEQKKEEKKKAKKYMGVDLSQGDDFCSKVKN